MHCSHFMLTERGPTKTPGNIVSRIEASGRSVSFTPEFLKLIPQNYAADGDSLVLTSPKMLGLSGGTSLRKVHTHAINRRGMRFVPPITAMVAAEAHRDQPVDEDIVVGMQFIQGPDGKPYAFCISHDVTARAGILDGTLCGKWLTAIYFTEPYDKCPDADYVAADQLIMYLGPK